MFCAMSTVRESLARRYDAVMGFPRSVETSPLSRMAMETRRKFDQDFKEGAVRLVRETGKLIAQVARELGSTTGRSENWVGQDRRRREAGDEATGPEAPRRHCRVVSMTAATRH